MALAVQSMTTPNLKHAGNNLSIPTPVGQWRTLDNNTFGPTSNELKTQFLEMQYPLIENFIYPWFLACLQTRTNTAFNYAFPRLDFAIKFYRSDYPSQIDKNGNGIIYPNYIYYFEGVYPDDIELNKLNQKTQVTDAILRSVSFGFNMMLVLPNKQIAKEYRLEHIWQGFTVRKS